MTDLMMICQLCERPGSEADSVASPDVCERCYREGWRTGTAMMGALAVDPVLCVDQDGKIGLERHDAA